jgi:predicted acetyltransferase
MSAEDSLPPGIEVVRAAAEQEPVLANLLELYAHDFSEVIDLQLHADGRFGYPRLAEYWAEDGRFPFLVKVDGFLAGFVLVSRGSRITGDPQVWDMAEFFVVRGYRKRGIGAAVAHETWRRFPGTWEVRVMEGNQPALAFWRSAVAAFTRSTPEAAVHAEEEKRWQVFSLASPAAAGAEPRT